MKSKTFKFSIIPALILFAICYMNAQDSNGEKEVIIIEKTVDQDGNVISKSIKRNQGNYTEDQLDNLLEDDNGSMLRSFDMEGMGFGNLEDFFGSRGRKNAKATLGIFIAEDNGQAVVSEVVANSGAAMADIRVGDKLISIEKVPVVTIEEIKEAIGDKTAGEEVVVVIWRDGSEIEKVVKLGGGSNNVFDDFFNSSDGSMLRLFGEDGSMRMNLDSLLEGMGGMRMDMFDFDNGGMENLFDRDVKSKNSWKEDEARPQLGVFIEDRDEKILVVDVIPDGAAAEAGIKIGDTIERIDDNRVGSFRELQSWMNTKSIGDEAILTISRKGKESQKKLILK